MSTRLKAYRVVHEIFEGDERKPTVVHYFYGDTAEEAMHVYEAHKKSDAFLRQCDEKGNFEGRFKCRSYATIEKLR